MALGDFQRTFTEMFGLRLEASIEEQLGFNTSGCYVVVLMNEAAGQELRLQGGNLRQQGWTVASDAA